MRSEMISLAGLKARGWTTKLIDTHLGTPDKLVANPNHRSGAPMRLYVMRRVEMAEAVPAVREKLGKRRAS